AADGPYRVSAGPGAEGPLFRPDPLPGVASTGLPGQLRDREAVRPPPADGPAVRRGHRHALRDAARGPEPDRLGDGHRALPPAAARPAHLRAHPRLQPPELLPDVPQRD